MLIKTLAAVAALLSLSQDAGPAAPIYEITLPPGYRDWRLISVAHEEGTLNDIRAVLVAGPPKNGVQFMVKDSKKYAASGGWGFAQFNDGKPADEALHRTCFPCHAPFKANDLVFTHYAP